MSVNTSADRGRQGRPVPVWPVLGWQGAIAGVVLAGFALDTPAYLAQRPGPALVIHAHAALAVGWLLAALAQAWLAARGRRAAHRRLGGWLVGLSAAMVPMGAVAALVAQARNVASPHYAPEFLALEWEELAGFVLFMGAALALRRRPEAHKRLMVLATLAIAPAGFSRAWGHTLGWAPPGALGWWWQFYGGSALMLAAMLAWDLRWRGRPHPALVLGGLWMLAGEALVTRAQYAPAWGRAMARLVAAWGWQG